MNSDEYSGLQRLKIPIIRWGTNYRIKIRNQYGITTFISNVKNPRNRKLMAKFYKISEKRINTELDYEYRKPRSYKFEENSVMESHEFVGFSQDEIYDKVKTFLEGLTRAVKINIRLGFKLIDRTNGLERDYYPSTNTEIWPSTAVAINSKADVERKVMSYMKATDFTERINYPSSAYQLKEINSVVIVIYKRDHSLGDSEIKIPECISKNRFIINFPKTDNKCVFYCIGYHLASGEKPDRRRVVSHAKERVKQFCAYENIAYSPKVFKEFQAVDIMQFDKLEDCFKLGINVWEMNEDTLEVSKIRSPEKDYGNAMNILEYKGHAMYITELDYVLNKYPCNGCDAIFDSADKLRNHKKTKCQLDVLESFAKKPTLYRPSENQVKSLLSKYKVYDVDHYMDHFIVYDFEAILEDKNRQSGRNTKYTKYHHAISVSVCDSLTKQVKCFVNESPRGLLTEMFDYIHQVSEQIQKYNLRKYRKVFVMIGREIRKLKASKGKYDSADEKVKILDKIIDKMIKEKDSLELLCSQSPLLGFNSGRYDINLVKNDLFAVLGTDDIKMVIKNPNYMCISTDKLKILDISNYLPAGTSYAEYLETYLGKCQCDDEIRCDCGLGKGMFCYDYLTSYERIFDEGLPPRSAFDSELKGTKCTESEYERLRYVWEKYNMKTVKDLLIWYNNLDVQPFVEAILKQREFYKTFGLDMFMDGVSLPGLSEKVMYQTCYDNLEIELYDGGIKEKYFNRVYNEIERLFTKIEGCTEEHDWKESAHDKDYALAYINVFDMYNYRSIFEFTSESDAKYIHNKLVEKFSPKLRFELDTSKFKPPFSFPLNRLEGYKRQDKARGRDFGLTINHLDELLWQECYLCEHCDCQLTVENVSADRIDNAKGHIDGNIIISCHDCNVARKDMNPYAFRHQKVLERNGDKLIWSIDQEQKEIYHKMKANIAGGPSIIFNRFAKRNETLIRGVKTCKKVIGYDANALYLWALANEMPCGRLTSIDAYEGIIDDIQSDKIFGFLECDIETPEDLKDYFSEMTPIFKNVEIDTSREDIIGEYMFNHAKDIGRKPTKSRKLIGSYFGEKILIYAPLLKWYLAHGLVVTKTYSFVKASSHRPFELFANKVSDARREGDKDESKAMIAEMMKLIGNAAFGRSGMDKSKHKEVKYLGEAKSVRAIVEKQNFHDVVELEGSYEVSLKKRRIKFNNPIHVSIAIYQLAKLRMLQFYYDCIDFYFDRSDFQYQEMDTDSAYIAFSDDKPFENIIKPELVDHFKQHKYDWFPRDYNKEDAAYDRRTPGLFKEEWRGDAMVSLSSKNYVCYLPEKGYQKKKDKWVIDGKDAYFKLSAKGVQKSKNIENLTPEKFESVIEEGISIKATNRGFRIDKLTNGIVTYEQCKTGITHWYDKRIVLADGITTAPLTI